LAQPADLQCVPLIVGGPSPGVPAVEVGTEEKELQHQQAVELDLEEDDGKQTDVDKAEQGVDGLLLTGKPDAGQAKQGADGFNPRHGVTAAQRYGHQGVIDAEPLEYAHFRFL